MTENLELLKALTFANNCVLGHTVCELLHEDIAYVFTAQFTKKNHSIFSIVTLLLPRGLVVLEFTNKKVIDTLFTTCFSLPGFLVFQKYFLFVW